MREARFDIFAAGPLRMPDGTIQTNKHPTTPTKLTTPGAEPPATS